MPVSRTMMRQVPEITGTVLDHWLLLLGLGAIVSISGQAGDLMLSSIKRDLGIKDMGVAMPGRGGLLDRYNSLLLVARAVFHHVTTLSVWRWTNPCGSTRDDRLAASPGA